MPLDVGDKLDLVKLSPYAKIKAECLDKITVAAVAQTKKELSAITSKEMAAVKDPIGSLESQAVHYKLVRALEIAEAEEVKKLAFVKRFNDWQLAGSPAGAIVDLGELGTGLLPDKK